MGVGHRNTLPVDGTDGECRPSSVLDDTAQSPAMTSVMTGLAGASDQGRTWSGPCTTTGAVPRGPYHGDDDSVAGVGHRRLWPSSLARTWGDERPAPQRR